MNKTLEDYYPIIIAELLKYIDEIKNNDEKKECALIDIIMDFAHKQNIDVEVIGDAVRSDVYLSSFIESDCLSRHIILSEKQSLDNW